MSRAGLGYTINLLIDVSSIEIHCYSTWSNAILIATNINDWFILNYSLSLTN